jgi:hypothetical protein
MQPGSLVRVRKSTLVVPRGSIGLITKAEEIPTDIPGVMSQLYTVSFASLGPHAPQTCLRGDVEVISERR